MVEEWDKFLAEGLVQPIDEGAAQFLVFAGGESCCNRARVPAIFHRVQAIDPGRQNTPRMFRGDLEIRNQENEVQLRRDGEPLPLPAAHDIETAVSCGGGVVGMALQRGAGFENLLPLERTAGQLIQAMEHSKADGGAAAEAARSGDITRDRTRERE